MWNLKDILLPSGANIHIDYEAKRYAYVQNKPAMRMYGILNYASGVNPTITITNPDPTKIITTADAIKLFDNSGKIYFKLYVDLTIHNKEFVTGYLNINRSKVMTDMTVSP